MDKAFWKKVLPYVASIFIFAAISIGYFAPDIFEGKVLFQHDTKQGIANGQEAKEYYEKTGERTRWTNSLFGGMPTYQISPSYDSTSILKKIERFYFLYLPSPAGLIFIMLVGFFILLRALNVKIPLAVMGSILYAFSSYFFIIISAGHIWKFITLAYIPPTIAGIILTYKGRYWLGGIVTAFFLAMQILSNHVQMSYYFGFVILAFVIAIFINSLKEKQLGKFFKATAVLIVAAGIAVCLNLSNLYHTYEYSKETMRGKAELSHNATNQTDNGLERDYIVQWSYGIGETWSLLIPNTKGGASGVLGYSQNQNTGEWKRDNNKNKEALEKADSNYRDAVAQENTYWGNQPVTSGPVYVGAFVFALFILGLFIVKSNLKWALLAVTVLSILLSWGKNFMPFTDFFLDYIPMYNKFRAVSSILVIAEFTIPLLAILTLKEIIENPNIIKEKKKSFWTGIGLVAGITLLFALTPNTFFDFLGERDLMQKENYINQINAAKELSNEQKIQQIQQVEVYFQSLFENLEKVRAEIFSSDAWRSFAIILIGVGFLLAFSYKKISGTVLVVCLTLLCFFDMASVDKRYLNSKNFVTKKEIKDPYPQTNADKMILQNKDNPLYYRVFNQSVDAFNDASTSYWHKSVGGYHAAKLRRYQDLIEHQLTKGNMEAYNMLNTRFVIVPAENGQLVAMQNPDAHGNAWFVNEIKWVNNADEEMTALSKFNALNTAVIDKRFEKDLAKTQISPKDSLSSIVLTEYEPNKLVFKVQAKKDELSVFSDIYYPGWKATIDGKEVPIARADYVLRAVSIPAGDHVMEFSFDPQSIHTTETIAYIALILLILGFIGYVGFTFFLKKKGS